MGFDRYFRRCRESPVRYLLELPHNNFQLTIPRRHFRVWGIMVDPNRQSCLAWRNFDHCVWDGPSYMFKTVSLVSALGEHLTSVLREFFHVTLAIQDVQWSHLIPELTLRSSGETKIISRHVRDIYSRLQTKLPDVPAEDLEAARYVVYS
jgi:hypothetical protein